MIYKLQATNYQIEAMSYEIWATYYKLQAKRFKISNVTAPADDSTVQIRSGPQEILYSVDPYRLILRSTVGALVSRH